MNLIQKIILICEMAGTLLIMIGGLAVICALAMEVINYFNDLR